MEKFEQIIEVGSDGNWIVDVPNSFDAGKYTVVVESLSTRLKDVGFFVIDAAQTIAEVLEAPSAFSFGIATLLAMVLFLSWYAVKLDRRIKFCEVRDDQLKLEHEQKHVHKAIFISSLCVILSLGVVFSLDRRYSISFIPEPVREISDAIQETIIPNVAGAVVSPVSNLYQSGVDLQSGNVSIRTSESGRYVFTNLNVAQPVKLTHPNLKRVISYMLKTNSDRIYFDQNLYNFIVSELEKEFPEYKTEQELLVLNVEVDGEIVNMALGYRKKNFQLKLSPEGEWQLAN